MCIFVEVEVFAFSKCFFFPDIIGMEVFPFLKLQGLIEDVEMFSFS